MVKLLSYGVTWKHIQNKNLLSWVMDTSTFLKIELGRIEKEKGFIRNVRGYGTYLGFDCSSPKEAEIMQLWFYRAGINLLRCGPQTFGMRPSLTLNCFEAAQLRDNLWYFSPNFPRQGASISY